MNRTLRSHIYNSDSNSYRTSSKRFVGREQIEDVKNTTGPVFEDDPPILLDNGNNQRKAVIEKDLYQLNIERDMVKSDLRKIENTKIKTATIIKEKNLLEARLDSINKQIAPLKLTIRKSKK